MPSVWLQDWRSLCRCYWLSMWTIKLWLWLAWHPCFRGYRVCDWVIASCLVSMQTALKTEIRPPSCNWPIDGVNTCLALSVSIIALMSCLWVKSHKIYGLRGSSMLYLSRRGANSGFCRSNKNRIREPFSMPAVQAAFGWGKTWKRTKMWQFLKQCSFISNLSYDRSKASSKTIPPLNAI
jgi:hypothetical protein